MSSTCPPHPIVSEPDSPATILHLAARASAAVNTYRYAMGRRADFRETMTAAGTLARATERLVTAIADSVAEGRDSLSD